MFESQRPIHRQIEDVDPGWLKAEVTAMARSALIAVGLSLTIGLSASEYLNRAKSQDTTRIVVAPEQPARAATSCADAPSRCEKPASSR
jgi:hypothetical protein